MMWVIAALFWIPLIMICFLFEPTVTVLAVLFLGGVIFTSLAVTRA